VVLAGCTSTSTPAGSTATNPKAAKPAGSWLYPNGNLDNTRDAAGAAISSANVAGLQQAWTFKLPPSLVTSGPGFGSLAATPIVANGVVYLQDLGDNVYALALATGKLQWEYRVSSKIVEGGPNGVALAGGVLYGDTTSTVFALSAATGKAIWVDRDLLSSAQGTFGIQPLVANGRIYLASSIGTGPTGGILLALNAATGKLVWKFNTVVPASNGAQTPYGSGGAWETPVGEHSTSDNYPLEAMEHKLTLTAPYTILPGSLGGVLSNLAVAGNTVYVATVDQQFTLAKMSYPLGAQDGRGAGEIEALNLTTGKVEWDTKVPAYPLGAATVSNDLVFTTLYTGVLIALDRTTGAVVYQRKLPTSANAPIAIAGNSILVPAGGPSVFGPKGGSPQLVVYTVR